MFSPEHKSQPVGEEEPAKAITDPDGALVGSP
jgi:hypothetical protein